MMIFRIQIKEGRNWDREALAHMKQELLAKRVKYIFFSPPNAPFWPVKCATMPARQSDNNAELHKAHGVLD